MDNETKTRLFTSTKQGEGKSTIISNVAYTFSKNENAKILLIDLDFRKPTIHKKFEVSNIYGLIDNLKNGRELERCIHKIDEHIDVLPTGTTPPNPIEVLSSRKMADFLKNIKKDYDYVFIDTPPVGIVSDASIISKYVDGVMFVVGADDTDLNHAKIAIENLKKANANVIGAVLNKYEADQSIYSYYGKDCYIHNKSSKHLKPKKKKKILSRLCIKLKIN